MERKSHASGIARAEIAAPTFMARGLSLTNLLPESVLIEAHMLLAMRRLPLRKINHGGYVLIPGKIKHGLLTS